jgi:hypothetical protein
MEDAVNQLFADGQHEMLERGVVIRLTSEWCGDTWMLLPT